MPLHSPQPTAHRTGQTTRDRPAPTPTAPSLRKPALHDLRRARGPGQPPTTTGTPLVVWTIRSPSPSMGRDFVVLLWLSGQAGLSPPAARSSDPMPSTPPSVLKRGPWQAALDEEGRACSLRFPPSAHITAGQAAGTAPGRRLWASPPLAASCHPVLLLPTSQGRLLSLLSWLLFLPDHHTLELPGARPQAPSLPPLPLFTPDRSSSLRKQAPRGRNHLEQYSAESVLSNAIC